MSIASIKAGKAFYEIFADDKTASGLSSAEQRLMRFGAKVGAIGAAMTAFAVTGATALTAMVKVFAGAGDNISDAMSVTGLSSDFLQSLQFAAADAGVSFDALIGSVTKFNNLLAKAASGNKAAEAALNKLGLSSAQLMALSPDDRFKTVADAIARIPDPAMRAAAAVALFGKSGAKMLPFLAGGAKGLADAMDEMKSKGLLMSPDDIAKAAEAEGVFLGLGLRMRRITEVIGAAVAPAFILLGNIIKSVMEGVIQFIDNNRGLVMGFTIVLGVIVVVGAALMALGAAAIFASLATTGFTMAMAAAGATAAFLSSPVFVISAAILACGAAAVTAAYHLDQLFNAGEGFNFIAGAAQYAAQGIQLVATALMNGQWGLAADFIATSIEQAFDSVILSIKQKWSDLFLFITDNAPFVSPDFKEALRQDQDALLADDRAAVLDSTTRMMQLMSQINGLKAGSRRTNSPSSRVTFDSASGGLRDIQTAGFLSSAAVGRIAQSAPGNQWQDKMLEATEEQTEVLEEIKDNLGRLESLTVE